MSNSTASPSRTDIGADVNVFRMDFWEKKICSLASSLGGAKGGGGGEEGRGGQVNKSLFTNDRSIGNHKGIKLPDDESVSFFKVEPFDRASQSRSFVELSCFSFPFFHQFFLPSLVDASFLDFSLLIESLVDPSQRRFRFFVSSMSGGLRHNPLAQFLDKALNFPLSFH